MPHHVLPASPVPAPRRQTRSAFGALVLALLALSPAPGAAATPRAPLALQAMLQAAAAARTDTTANAVVTAESPRATRAQLTAALERAEQAAAQGSGKAREQAQREVAAIRTRLRVGDFQTGDRIALAVGGDTTRREVTVREGVQIDLPYGIPSLSLAGVLRSEVAGVVDTHLRKYVRDPDVRVRALQRINVTGAVGRPGVYWVAPDVPIAEMVMLAGGTRPDSRIDRISILRAGRQVIDRKAYAHLVGEGRTLEEADLQPGDEIHVPTQKPNRNVGQFVTYAFFAVSALTALLALVRASYQ